MLWRKGDEGNKKYYPFGIMSGRQFSGQSQYRYGFNGKEEDDEFSGDNNVNDYGFRIYNPALGKFLSMDPLMKDFSSFGP